MDELLLSFAFNFNLRRYSKEHTIASEKGGGGQGLTLVHNSPQPEPFVSLAD